MIEAIEGNPMYFTRNDAGEVHVALVVVVDGKEERLWFRLQGDAMSRIAAVAIADALQATFSGRVKEIRASEYAMGYRHGRRRMRLRGWAPTTLTRKVFEA